MRMATWEGKGQMLSSQGKSTDKIFRGHTYNSGWQCISIICEVILCPSKLLFLSSASLALEAQVCSSLYLVKSLLCVFLPHQARAALAFPSLPTSPGAVLLSALCRHLGLELGSIGPVGKTPFLPPIHGDFLTVGGWRSARTLTRASFSGTLSKLVNQCPGEEYISVHKPDHYFLAQGP